jgi:hypothetical protein
MRKLSMIFAAAFAFVSVPAFAASHAGAPMKDDDKKGEKMEKKGDKMGKKGDKMEKKGEKMEKKGDSK